MVGAGNGSVSIEEPEPRDGGSGCGWLLAGGSGGLSSVGGESAHALLQLVSRAKAAKTAGLKRT
jgi:hypothetical protein